MSSSAKSLSHLDLRGRKVLIADGDEANLRTLSGILKAEGYMLAYANHSAAVLDTYAQFLPDLALLDMTSPIDGVETCRTLKKIYGAQCAPVIFMTTNKASDDVVEGLGAGGVDYLPKPYNETEVLARIRSQLRHRVLAEQQSLLVAQLSKANADKNRFLSMAAHDLRNPLASIHCLADFLRDRAVGDLSPDQADLVAAIHDASQSMLGMVNELLDVVSIESGALKLVLAPTNLAELIEKSVYLANIEAAKKKTHIAFDPQGLAPIVQIDGAKMKQVIDNLLSNAVKYSPPGSHVTAELHTDAAGRACGFGVKDQGPGIPEQERDKLFKDFGRLSVKPTGGEKSTGLGLAICRKIVESHGGTIAAENLPERGCEFRVTLNASS